MSIDERKVKWDSEVSIDESKIKWDDPKAIDESKVQWDDNGDWLSKAKESANDIARGVGHFATLPSRLMEEALNTEPTKMVGSALDAVGANADRVNSMLAQAIRPTYRSFTGGDNTVDKYIKDVQDRIKSYEQKNTETVYKDGQKEEIIKPSYEASSMLTHPLNAVFPSLGKAETLFGAVGHGAGIGTGISAFDSIADNKDMTLKDTVASAGTLAAINAITHGLGKIKTPDTIKEDTQTPTNFDAQSYLDSTKASKASEELGLNDNPNYKTMEEIKAYIAENDKGGQTQADLFEQQMNLWAKAENLRRAEEGREPVTAEQMANDFILKYEAQPKEVVNENVTTDNLQNHPRFQELMDMRRDVSSKDTQYSQTLVQPRGTDADGNWYGASYDRNFNADFELTKADVKAIESGKATPEQITKLQNDLGRLENDPMYKQAPMDANEQLAANGELFQAKELEDRYLKNDRVIESAIMKDADTLPKPISSYQEFKSHFAESYESKGTYFIDTPIGSVKVDPRYSFNHLTDNTHFNDRGYISGAFVDTLKNPLFVVEKKYKDTVNQIFYKPFKGKNGNYHLASFTVDKNGMVHKTFFELDSLGKLMGLIKVADKDMRYFKHSQKAETPDTGRSVTTTPKSAYDEIIPQNIKELNQNIKGSYKIDEKLITMFESHDFSTINHELGHRFLFTLNARERAIAEKAFGVKDGKWEVKNHEAFADAYARYIADGRVQHEGLRAIFEKFKEFTKKILSDLQANNGGKLPPMSKEAKEFFAAVLGNEKARNELMKKYTSKDASSMGEGELFSKAYHGTPHNVDKFDTEKIGTGEGAQAYGYGLYFADSKELAEWYKNKLSKNILIHPDVKEKYYKEWGYLAKKQEEALDNHDRISAQKYSDAIDELLYKMKDETSKSEKFNGNLYRVDLKPKEEEYLLWDKPLDEQSLHVKEALQKELDIYRKSDGAKGAYVNNSSGEKLYKEFIYTYGSDKKASERLNELGIKGIKYEDGNSRSRDVNKNHNYVIFKNEDVEITGANGKMFDGTPNELFQTSKERQDRLMEWHKDSAPETKNADGTPKVFYHGTGADFSEFQPNSRGLYFVSPDSKWVNNFIGSETNGINIMPVYVSVKKPFDYENKLHVKELSIKASLGKVARDEISKGNWVRIEDRGTIEAIKSLGYDGVFVKENGIKNLAVFDHTQIKSIHNKGTFDENNPNILYQRTDLSVGDETLMESVQRKVQDKFLRVKKLIEAKANINAIADKLNPYLAEELYHGRVQNRLDQFQKDYVEPIIKKISSSKVTIDQVDEYLHARHAMERNKKMEELSRAKNKTKDGVAVKEDKIIKDGSGMSDAEAVRILAKYANNTDMLDIAKMVYAMNKDRLKLIYKEGLESADFIKTIDGTYNNYVPLKRVMDSDGNYMSTGKGFDIKGKELKRAHGSNRKVESPLLNSILAFNETIIRAEKNEVGKAMINFAEAYPDANLYEVNSLKHVPQYDSNGDVISMNPKYQLANNVLHVKIDGKVKEIVFKDPLLARAFKNLSSEQMDAVMRGAHKLIRYYASINTQYNPEFVISNFERDLQTAMINLPEEVKGSRAIILRDVFSAMNGIHKAIYERTPNEWSKLYAEMKAEGGTTGWIEQYNVPDMKKSTEILIRKYEGEVMPKEAFKAALEHIDNINTVIENASRLVVYKMAKESGLSNKRSASIAKNLTVNFNRKGEMGQALNLTYMFFNASIQGTTRTIQAIRHSKVVQGIVGGIIASSTALTLYNMSQNEEAYSLIPQYEKDTNLIFMNEDGTYKKVKVPYGYNVFKSLGDIMAESYNGDLKPEKIPSRILGIAVNAFSPIGTAPTLGQMVTPTIARPAVDLAVNKNFAGNPIQPEKNGFGASSPDSYNYFNSVNPMAKSIAQEANKLTGGNMYKSGMADVSPETIEYLFETATGGVGKFFNRVYKTASGNAETNDIPFVRNFIGETTDKSKQAKVYDIYKRSGEEIINQKELDRFVKFGREGVSNGSIEPDRFISMVTTIASNQAKLKWADRNNIQSKDDVLNSPSIMMDALQSGVPKSEILSIAKKKKKEDEALLKR